MTLPAFLAELPVVGPLLSGSVVAVALRVAGLVAVVFFGSWALRKVLGGPGARYRAPASTAALVREGRLEEAGDLASRQGDQRAALGHYEGCAAWLKAGHAARRLGDQERAGACFEKARDLRLAAAAYEAAGNAKALARVGARSAEPALLAKAAAYHLERGEAARAGELYQEAGMLADAERAFVTAGEEGARRAASMYLRAYEEVAGTTGAAGRARDLARRAVDLLTRVGEPTKAASLRMRAGLDPPPGAPGARAAPARHVAGRGDDGSIEAPLSSLDALVAAAPAAAPEGKGRTAVIRERSLPANRTPPSTELLGADVASRYEILGLLGRGGMGEVYEARDRTLGRTVALKFLSPGLVGDERAMRFFAREARAAAALSHPAIVTVYDVGVLSGRPFISMEKVEGTDLASRLAEQGPLEEGHALQLVVQVALALNDAHEKGVVHRDIKPSNIMQTRGGMVKLLDFGLAKAVGGPGKGGSMIAGTPEYMAPEQLAGGEVDGRVDLFALGVTSYELLTGQTPFRGLARSAAPDPPSVHAPWLLPGVDEVVLKAIALEPEARYRDGQELAAALRRLLKAERVPPSRS